MLKGRVSLINPKEEILTVSDWQVDFFRNGDMFSLVFRNLCLSFRNICKKASQQFGNISKKERLFNITA